MKSGFWKSDWLLGVLAVVAFTAANLFSEPENQNINRTLDIALQPAWT